MGSEKEPLLGCPEGCGQRGCKGVDGNGWEKEPLGAQTAADGVGEREWVEMGSEKEPLGLSELGCADGCGRRGCIWMRGQVRTACKGVGAAGAERAWMRGRLQSVEMGREKESRGLSELGCADGCGRRGRCKLWLSELGCADGRGRRGCGRCGRKAGGGNRFDARTGGRRAADGVGASESVKKSGWGEGAAGMRERGCGRVPTASAQRRGCKRAGGKLEMSELRLADWCGRRGADGVGAREWVEMCGEKEPAVEMSELGCARVEKGGGRRGCKGVGGNVWGEGAGGGDERARMRKGGKGWGEGAAGGERAWMRGRLRGARVWVGGWGEGAAGDD
eukprot:s762_g10.t1